ncbi:Holliday junction branch migration protein RuvA [Candidatus Parcubacteria bacterium]|nr:MAG: Holliday junction branch migration protein RuvA [Candidatus Parcubacteria bacterium]
MIRSVKGNLVSKTQGSAVIEVGGVGFEVISHEKTIKRLPPIGGEAALYTFFYLREDKAELYGFLTKEELRFFELLNSVAGIGPKSALSILEVADLHQLASAIRESRPDLLVRASGVGRKTAERVVLELKNKVDVRTSAAALGAMESDADITEALIGLGYRRDEARRALERVDRKISKAGERLKAALKSLGRKES